MTGVAPSDGKSQAATSGARAPSTVGPRRMPPTISPITRGCRTDAKSPPTRWAATNSVANASRMCAMSVVEGFMVGTPGGSHSLRLPLCTGQ